MDQKKVGSTISLFFFAQTELNAIIIVIIVITWRKCVFAARCRFFFFRSPESFFAIFFRL